MGEAAAFFLNSLSFVAVIFCLLRMRNLPAPPSSQGNNHQRRHITEGVRYVLQQETLLVLMSLIAVSAFLSMPYNVLMPVFANQVLRESAAPIIQFLCLGDQPLLRCQAPEALPLGMLLAAVGIGAVSGALLAASLPEQARRGRLLAIGNLCFPLVLLFFAGSRSMILSASLMVLVGMSFVLQNSMANTLIQISIPDELRGRIMGVYSLMHEGMSHVGGVQAGLVADWGGAQLAIGSGAAISLAYSLFVAFRFPRVHKLT